MGEKKKLYIMLGIIVGIVVLIIGICLIDNHKIKALLKEIDEKKQANETQIFYLSRPTCHYCLLLKPITDELKEEYQLSYYNINTDQYNNSQMNKILKKFNVLPANFGTPYIAITKNGEIIGELNGYADENVVFELFKKHGLIPEDATLAFQYLTYEAFQNIWNSGERKLVMIGETGEESVEARILLKKLIQTHPLEISYMDIAEIGTNEAYIEFLNMVGFTSQPVYPILMVIENGKIVSQISKVVASEYESFLRNNGYIG